MKIIVTVVTSLLLSLGLLVAPVSADEPPAPPCEVVEIGPVDGPDAIGDLIAARARVELLEGRVDGLMELHRGDERLIERQTRRLNRQAATIERLRAKLAATR